MDYKRILQPICDRLAENAEFETDMGTWEATSSTYVGDVLFSARWKSNGLVELVDCLHDVPHDYRDLSNVGDWIEEHLRDSDDLAELHEDALKPYDEWDEHGFRDAQDYYNYRFGSSLR